MDMYHSLTVVCVTHVPTHILHQKEGISTGVAKCWHVLVALESRPFELDLFYFMLSRSLPAGVPIASGLKVPLERLL